MNYEWGRRGGGDDATTVTAMDDKKFKQVEMTVMYASTPNPLKGALPI
jgi:hypothetical protein